MGIRNTRSLAARAFDGPTRTRLHQLHLASLSPPSIDVAGKRHPDSSVCPKLLQISEQLLVNVLCAVRKNVVGMGDDADESVATENQIELLMPQRCRVIVQDMEQCVVLC